MSKRLHRVYRAACLGAAVCLSVSGALAAQLTIRGQVTAKGEAVSRAELSLAPISRAFEQGKRFLEGVAGPDPVRRSSVDSQGYFEIAAPELGMWSLRVDAPGYAPAEYRIQPLLDDVELPTLALEDADRLAVEVRGAEGRPVSARVLVFRVGASSRFVGRPTREQANDAWNLPLFVGRTDEEGRYEISVEDGGAYFVRVQAPGYVPAERELREASEVRFDLEPGRERQVRTVDAEGDAVAGALIYPERSRLPLAVAGEDGRATLVQGGEPIRLHAVDAEGRRGSATVAVIEPEDDIEPEDTVVTLEEPSRLAGRVVDSETRRGVGGALVWLSGRSGDFQRTGGDGTYQLTGAGREQNVWATARGYSTAYEEARGGRAGAPAAAVGQVPTHALTPAAVVSGRVIDVEGQPVAGVEIVAAVKRDMTNPGRMLRTMRTPSSPKTARSSRNGGFRMAGLVAGSSYDLTFTNAGFAKHLHVVETLRPFEERSGLEIVLERGRRGFGRVEAPDETPIVGAEVRLDLRPEGEAGRMRRIVVQFGGQEEGAKEAVYTDGEGYFEVADLAAGKYDLAVEASGFARASIPGLEIPEDLADVDLGTVVLDPGVPIEGRVADANGQPITDAEIRVGQDQGMPAAFLRFALMRERPRARSNAKGEFTVGDLRDGEKVHLLVSRKGFVDATVAGVVAPTVERLEVEMKPSSRVLGRVVDDSGQPVGEAAVRVDAEGRRGLGQRTRSRADGTFEVEDVAPGRVSVTAEAGGYQEFTLGGLEVPDGADLTGVELVLSPGAIVEGTVFAPDGRPVIGATMRAVEPGSTNQFSFGLNLTDGDGRYWIDGLPLGRRTVVAEHDIYQRVARDVEIEKGVNELDLVYEGGVEVSGRVIGPQGGPVDGAQVRLSSSGDFFFLGGFPETTSGADGGFVLSGVQPGQYNVVASKEGYAMASAADPVTVGEGPVAGVEVRLVTGATLTGEIRGLAIDELSQLRILAIRERDFRGGEVNFEGRYEVKNLGPGEWQVSADVALGERRATGTVTVEENDLEVSLDLEFDSGYILTGTVLAGDRPMAGAWIALVGKTAQSFFNASASQDGTFRFENVPEGTYDLSVRSADFSGSPHREEIEITGDDDVLIELVTARISGFVRDAFDQMPLSGVRVQLRPVEESSDEGFIIRIGGFGNETDSRGYFSLSDVPEGRFKLVATKAGYGPAETLVDVEGRTVEQVELEMSPTEGIFFEAAWAMGGAPRRVWVAVLRTPGGGSGDVLLSGNEETGENGGVRVTEVPPGSFELLVRAPGSSTVAIPVVSPGNLGRVVLPVGGTLKIDVPELRDAAMSVDVQLTGPGGRPYRRIDFGGRLATEVSMRSGRATVEGLDAGVWSFTVTAEDGRSWSGQREVAAGAVAEVELR